MGQVAEVNYSRLKVLVADDFSNFRSTINSMLGKLGVNSVDTAANGQEVLNLCQRNRYDVILCDYDLGPGKNGQQVLEELRASTLITRKSLFIVISADAAKDVVMAAYDCEPDDYLMKPITAKMLQQRMSRLLMQRQALGPAFCAVESGQNDKAIAMLIDMSIAEGRYAVAAQKLLGEMFLLKGDLNKAEKLYVKALQERQLDWARLGLARVKQRKGELEVAGDWLEKIVSDNPLYLPAYDCLAENWRQLKESQLQQETVQRSIDISPRSILRHKNLAIVAEQNDDLGTALKALRSVVKLGELSCHARPEDGLNFARVASLNIERQLQPVEPLASEAVDVLDLLRERFPLTREQALRADLLEGRALVLGGQMQLGRAKVDNAERAMSRLDPVPLDLQLERVAALQALGDTERAEQFVAELVDDYGHDQEVLERLDALLPEPVSDSSREMIASVNREGIELYNQHRFDEAIQCFEKVLHNFPRHVGVHLNIVQSLIGKLKEGMRDENTTRQAEESLGIIGSLVAPGHAQFARYERLKAMAATSLAER